MKGKRSWKKNREEKKKQHSEGKNDFEITICVTNFCEDWKRRLD